jgi:hypothetical protein
MSSFSQSEKRKNRRSHLGRNASIVGFLVLIALIVWSQTSPLSANDFYFGHIDRICGYDAHHLRFLRVNATLQNNKNTPFHFLSAKVSMVSYTLSNGTVVPVNLEWIDNETTFSTIHMISWQAQSNMPVGGPTPIASIEFVVTASIQEVAQQIILPVAIPNKDISC